MKQSVRSIVALGLALGLLLCLAGCGGDSEAKKEAIAEFNTTSEMFNKVGTFVNEHASEIGDEDVISSFQQMAQMLNRYAEILENNDDLTDDEYAQMIDWFHSVQEWTEEIQAMIDAAYGEQ